jgi:hypothetical protein
MTAEGAFIATLADGSGYVLILDGKVVSTHATIAAAIKARTELEAEPEAPKRLIRRSSTLGSARRNSSTERT